MVVDHGSTDGTSAIARRALAELSEYGVTTRMLAESRGGVGTARHIGIVAMTEHWRRAERAWVLSTDADSRVRPDWIMRFVHHAELGARAVAGVVDLFDEGESSDFRDRWRDDYGSTMRPDGTHPHAHAANLGLRLDVYRCSGGFRDVGPADDRDLWQRLRARGVEPIADSSIVVDTSGRRTGRVPAGFATALSTLYPIDRDGPVGFAAGAAGAAG
jgi:glycosyltransferase involved in cell wall biosynthesis